MYPFRSRSRWFLAHKYRHILRAFESEPPTDTLVQERLESLRRWSGARDVVATFLYLGLVASLTGIFSDVLPPMAGLTAFLQGIATWTSTFAGALAVTYLVLTRVLGQLETDIWAFLSTR